jgi:hypothetical protein
MAVRARIAAAQVLAGAQTIFGADCPSVAPAPDGYRLDPEGLVRVAESKAGEVTHLVCRQPLTVCARQVDVVTGAVSLDLAWRSSAGRWTRHSVSREVTASARSIVGLAAKGASVTSGEAAEVVRYVAACDALLTDERRVTRRLGWHDGGVDWVSGGWSSAQAPTWRVAGDGVDAIVAAMRPHGTWEGWRAGAIRACEVSDAARMAIAASVAPMLLDHLGMHGFAVEWAAMTGTGKSTVLRLGASVWGDSAEGGLLRTWDDTPTFLGAIAGCMHHHSIWVDETKRANGDWGKVREMIFKIHSGIDRGRGQIDGTARGSQTYRGVLHITGEVPSCYAIADGGVKGRVLTCLTKPLPSALVAREVLALVQSHYGHAGPRVARWLHEAPVEYLPGLRARWHAHRDALATSAGDHPTGERLAAYAACLEVAGELLEEVLDWRPDGGWYTEAMWQDALAATSAADGAAETHREIVTWARTSGRLFAPGHVPSGGWIGADRGDGVLALVPAAVREFCGRAKRDYDEWLAAARRRDWVDLDGGRTTHPARVGTALVRVLLVRDDQGQGAAAERDDDCPM